MYTYDRVLTADKDLYYTWHTIELGMRYPSAHYTEPQGEGVHHYVSVSQQFSYLTEPYLIKLTLN